MSTRAWWGIVILLLIVITVLAWFLFATPAPISAPANMATTTQPASSTPSTSTPAVSVSTPAPNATVGQTFGVAGIAPNTWYFEAVFPIKVVDPNDNTIGSGQAQAQSDWTVEGPVPFTSTITISGNYTGPATLVLLKDNESGLPQNDDSISVPIVIE